MALPAKELETPVRETGIAPSTTFVSPTPVLTWARVVQAERVSLVHAHQQNNDQDLKPVIYYSRVWRVGCNSDSVIFDISPCPGFVNEAISKAMTIFPNSRVILIHLDKNVKIQKVRLCNLPLLDQDELEKGLHETFGAYGEILDVAINRDPQTKAYMCNGFAVLDIQERTHRAYTKLNHHVPRCGNRDDLIYANFNQMSLYCSRCHEAGHARNVCVLSPRQNNNGYLVAASATAASTSLPAPQPIKTLAYADDILVFLHNTADLDILFHHLNIYQKAFNAKFNRNKTQTISLPGKPSSTWNAALEAYGLPPCHD
ncbi:hypothetical protein INT45_006099 [Circinella minor]|uniref:RRM domain-containing protein n=1 Tax=Circinella minor TaxID=1195481 RepID=A0A8H7S6Z4_9FUNG|nr:hypothetical protein INT45_006099 [Circinella minor]